MKTKQIKEAKEIISAFEPGAEFSKIFECKAVVSTCFGPLHICLNFNNRRNSHALYMRFEQMSDYNRGIFQMHVYNGRRFNGYSLRWDFESRDAEFILTELEERLGNLKYFAAEKAHLIESIC